MAIVKRLTKGSALTHAELDGNFTDLDGRVSTLESASDSDSQTLTLAGTNLSISGGNTVDLSGLDSDTNTYVSSGTFDNATKTITLTKSDATTVPVDISSITVTESQISDFGTYLVDLTEESLGTLADVDLVSNPPTAGQPLVWDAVNTLWKPGAAVELQTLADVTANGATTNDNVILGGTLSITGDVSANADLTVTGAFDAQGPAAFDGLISFNGTVNTGIVFEGVTVDDFETTINATDPTADRTITFPDASGTVALLSDISGGSYNDASVDTHLNTSTATANQVLSWNGSDYAWVADQTGAGSNAITQGDSAVTVTDTGSDGNIEFKTENTARWDITSAGHLIPATNSTYDIGSAEFKVRHFYLSSNSLKFVDDSDPLNPVEYPVGISGDNRLTFNSNSVKTTSYADAPVGGAIDITLTNHFIVPGQNYSLADGTYIGQELKLWRNPGSGFNDITVANAIWTNGSLVTATATNFTWRLEELSTGMYSCIWNGTGWILANGSTGA